jgi:hypothetical protein
MKLSAPLLLLTVVILISGCASKKPVTARNSIAPAPQMIVTPDNSLAAKVVSYDSAGRFVVLSFPMGRMPNMGQSLFLYRGGLKAGEVKITGPQSDNNTVADLVSGDAQVGDEVRDQ